MLRVSNSKFDPKKPIRALKYGMIPIRYMYHMSVVDKHVVDNHAPSDQLLLITDEQTFGAKLEQLTPNTAANQDAGEESVSRSLEFGDSSDTSTSSDGENGAHLERGDSADSGFHLTGMSSDEDDFDHQATRQDIPPELIDEINRLEIFPPIT